MGDKKTHDPGRRFFLTTVAPACALLCFGGKDLAALAQTAGKGTEEEPPHKFDGDLGRELTIRQHFGNQYREYIELAKALEKEWGKDRTTEFLKKTTTEKMTAYGQRQASRSPNNNFEAFVGQFRGGYDKVLTMDIVEDTDTAFELNVTECIWADTFRGADAGDIGYCSVCWGDYAWARSFNKNLEMVRDKTLMQGHDRCNHRYLWKA